MARTFQVATFSRLLGWIKDSLLLASFWDPLVTQCLTENSFRPTEILDSLPVFLYPQFFLLGPIWRAGWFSVGVFFLLGGYRSRLTSHTYPGLKWLPSQATEPHLASARSCCFKALESRLCTTRTEQFRFLCRR